MQNIWTRSKPSCNLQNETITFLSVLYTKKACLRPKSTNDIELGRVLVWCFVRIIYLNTNIDSNTGFFTYQYLLIGINKGNWYSPLVLTYLLWMTCIFIYWLWDKWLMDCTFTWAEKYKYYRDFKYKHMRCNDNHFQI